MSLLPDRSCGLHEKIIFFIDLHNEMNGSELSETRGNPHRSNAPQTRLDFIKKVVQLFINCKQKLSKNHAYTICGMTDVAIDFEIPFTTQADAIVRQMRNLRPSGDWDSFSLDSLFTVCEDKMVNCQDMENYVYRAIIIYGRSRVRPTVPTTAVARRMQHSPKFYSDVVFLHKKVGKESDAFTELQSVFDALGHAEHNKHESYFLETATQTQKLYHFFAQLLAHPQQRPAQKNFKCLLRNAYENQTPASGSTAHNTSATSTSSSSATSPQQKNHSPEPTSPIPEHELYDTMNSVA
eukprot:TRINITY_DN16682_c0_g1_i1.p1 TRINITY_DN16682_c0_g1~~TRINITY_DN16682_c0_g1_i1.p1  ORF type:complete len:295 (+),score=7.30 TRINITY_DN16682_c0_g1_i1:53-937(+)